MRTKSYDWLKKVGPMNRSHSFSNVGPGSLRTKSSDWLKKVGTDESKPFVLLHNLLVVEYDSPQ